MKKLLLLCIAAIFHAAYLPAQTTLWTESFETDGNGTRYTTSILEFSDGSGDYFTRTDGSNIGSSVVVTGADGSFFFAAQDIDGEGAAATQSLTISGINISGYSNLQFRGSFAEDDDGSDQDWDEPDYLRIFYSIDGGSEQNLLWIENDGSTFNSAPFVDTDFDGTGDGTEITSTFDQLSAAIAGTGSSLTIRIEFSLDSGDEDIAIDLLQVTGESLTCPASGIVYVDITATTGLNNGSSWMNAYTDLGDALAFACDCDDSANSRPQIWVADGTYTPSEEFDFDGSGGNDMRERTFALCDDVEVYGGFEGLGGAEETMLSQRNPDPATNGTILSGDLNGDDVDMDTNGLPDGNISDNVYHVVTGSGTGNTAILDGFTITAGNADGTDANRDGGGMYNDDGSPTLNNVLFKGNASVDDGGGMYNRGGSAPTVNNGQFIANRVVGDGGAAVDNNGSSPTFVNALFLGNATVADGGSGNDANGGAVRNVSGSMPIFINATFSGNFAENEGGAIYNEDSGTQPTLINTIIWNNEDGSGNNSIVNDGGASANFSFSLVEGENPGGDNLDGTDPMNDPQFVMPAIPTGAATMTGDLRLQSTSPALNVGDNSVAQLDDDQDIDNDGNVMEATPDLDLNERIASTTIDLGAYELATGTITIVKATNPTPVDENFNFTGSLGDFTLNTSGTAEYMATVPAGPYTITEALPANWDLTGITCEVGGSGSSNFSVDLDAGSVEIDLAAGEDVTCTFTNERWGTLTVEKEVLPDNIDIGSDDAFNIWLNGQTVIENGTDGSSFGPAFIAPDEMQTLAEVASSSNTNLNDYCVAITCVNASDQEVAQADGPTLSDFSVGLTEEITCTVTNTLRPTADAGEDMRLCLTKTTMLADAVISGSATTGKWSVIAFPEGGDNAWTLDTNPTENPEAVEFSATVPGIYELQLMTDNPDDCDPAMDTKKIEVLNVGCGSGNFPWDGSKRNGNN